MSFESPLEANREAKGAGAIAGRQGYDGGAPGTDADELDVPNPQGAGLLSKFFPFDRESMEGAIDQFLDQLAPFDRASMGGAFDQFLDQLDDLVVSLFDSPGPMALVPVSLAISGAILASEIALRSRRAAREDQGESDADLEARHVRFPGLPDLRSR